MAGYYSTFEGLLKRMEKDIEIGMKEVSKQVLEIWKGLVEDNFYGVYTPKEYPRTWETLDALVILDVNKSGGAYEITLGYDEAMIKTFKYISSRGEKFTGHSDPSLQGTLIEYGWEMRNGIEREGAHAFEEMLNYVRTDNFIALFNNEMRKLGYII